MLAAHPVGLVLAHRDGVEPHAVLAQPGDEVNPSGRSGEPGKGVGTKPRVEHVVLLAAIPEGEANLFGFDRLGALFDLKTLVESPRFRIGVIHLTHDSGEDRVRPEHVNRHLAIGCELDRGFEVVLVVSHFVGDDDHHEAVGVSLRILIFAPTPNNLADGLKRRLDPAGVERHAANGVGDLVRVGGWLIGHRLTALAKRDDTGEKAVVVGEVLFVDPLDPIVDRFNMLGQAFAFALETSRGVERPDDEGSPFLQAREDLIGKAVDGSFRFAHVLRAGSLDEHVLAEHGRRRNRHHRGALDVQHGQGSGAFGALDGVGLHRAGLGGDVRQRKHRRERPRGKLALLVECLVDVLKGGGFFKVGDRGVDRHSRDGDRLGRFLVNDVTHHPKAR